MFDMHPLITTKNAIPPCSGTKLIKHYKCLKKKTVLDIGCARCNDVRSHETAGHFTEGSENHLEIRESQIEPQGAQPFYLWAVKLFFQELEVHGRARG
jgi:hypothetical protein